MGVRVSLNLILTESFIGCIKSSSKHQSVGSQSSECESSSYLSLLTLTPVKRFKQELNLWTTLDHDHILPFYGIVTDLGPNIHMVPLYARCILIPSLTSYAM